MKKYFISLFMLCAISTAVAQQSVIDIRTNPNTSANGYLAYPGPQKAKLTPAPKGYKPFYISHYGRHGSRYLIGTKAYDAPYNTLLQADSLGKLTPLGKETLQKVRLIRNEAHNRDGELTPLGAEQHKQIAKRMYHRFPEVFRGTTNIEANSTTIVRCILSMENALQQLLTINPKLNIKHDASQHDMYYMNQPDPKLQQKKMTGQAKEVYDAFSNKHQNYRQLMNKLFVDTLYWQNHVDAPAFFDQLYNLASNIQSTQLRHQLSLYNIFTHNELYDAWLRTNAWWYIAYGPSPLNGGTQPYSQRNLLRKIISQADSCIALAHPGATLRYGHDTMIMPLVCLLNLNGYGKQIADLEQLDHQNWLNYRIFPMACNLQFIFYRSKKQPDDILIKVLQNEDEATLPLSTDIAPYYRWADFKKYYLEKLNAYVDQ